MTRKTIAAIVIIICFQSSNIFANIKLPALIADGMVLQRNISIPIWGWASAGAEIEINFRGKIYKTLAGSDGKWMLSMDKQNAGGPYEMYIRGDGSNINLKNILIGEVWVCSGQSNMEYNFREPRALKHYAKEIEESQNDMIRQLEVKNRLSSFPIDDVTTTGWKHACKENLPEFSLAAYFFAKNLFDKYHVPVGLINSAIGGTPAEAWTSKEALKEFPQFIEDIAFAKDSTAISQKFESDKLKLENWRKNGNSTIKEPRVLWPYNYSTVLFNSMINPLLPYAIKGAIWYQGESNASRAMEYRSLFPNMIKDWRTRWGQGDFPFIFQQLVNFTKTVDTPSQSKWAELREAQTLTLSVSPNTGMAVGVDIGESDDIHPVNKKDVGYRFFYLLYLWLTAKM